MGLQLVPELFIDFAGTGGHHFGKTQGHQLTRSKQVTMLVNMV